MTRIKIKHLLEKYISTIMPVLIFLLGFFVGRNYPDILNQVVVLTKEYSSLIVAVATISLVGVTKSLVRVTINQNKPWLYFYFKRKSLPNIQNYIQSPSLYVKNVGKGPAIKIEFKIEQTERSLHALSPDEEVNINEMVFDISNKSNKIEIKGIKCNDLNKQLCKQDDVTLQA